MNIALDRKRILHLLFKYLVIVAGSVVFAFAFRFFLFPNNIASGGVMGIAMIINELTGLPVGMLSIAMNIPLFIIAWRSFGLSFMVGSMVGMFCTSVLVDVFAVFDFVATYDDMLACFIGGVIKGLGLGFICYVGASTGGIDIVAKFLRKKFAFINFGTIIMLLDVLIFAAYALVLGKYESAMYSIIAMFIVTKVIDMVLYGMDNSCICYVISEKSGELVQEIISGNLHRGVTLLEAQGAYTGLPRQVAMCVIKQHQIGAFKALVRSVDDKAFVIVSDVKNVFGKGFESISEVK